MSSALALQAIAHDYGDGPVLHDVDLSVAPGEVHALLGMNGAGKSTLVHIASGFFSPSHGTVAVNGAAVSWSRPADAQADGVALLAQEVDRALVPHATVHENLTAGLLRARRQRGFSARRNRRLAASILDRYSLALDLDRLVSTLSLFEKQSLSLVRAAAADARVLLLDEPTSSFDRAETERFYGIVRALTAEGIAIIFISHRLREVFEIADEITVLRDGRVELNARTDRTDPDAVVAAITGRTIAGHRRRAPAPAASDATTLHFDRLDLGSHRPALGLRLRGGEITAIYGNLGAGKSSIARTLFGLGAGYEARIDDTVMRVRDAPAARRAGIQLVPEERRTQGLWLDESIGTHSALGFRGIIHPAQERAHARRIIADYRVEPANADQRVGRLSGGNQQKVALGKWAGFPGRRLLVLDEPMKGVDVGARETLFDAIEHIAAQGAAVLYLTQEPDEALRIADRILVLDREGFVLDRPADELTARDLLLTERIAS